MTLSKKTRNQKNSIIEELHLYNILLDTREIFLHDNNEDGIDYCVSNDFIKNLILLENLSDNPIIIHQQSLGGNWSDGMAIYDMIANSKCHIIFIMHGAACSMGSIIPQAADTRIIMPSCLFMLHDGYTGVSIDMTHKQSQSQCEIEFKLKEHMLDIYCGVCVNGFVFQKNQDDKKKVKEFLINRLNEKEDWWLFARDTVNYGFADAVFGDENYENIGNIKDYILNAD